MAEKPLRQAMPTVAAWIDELRAAFGAESINPAIRNGMAGGTQFFAQENGHTLGRDVRPGWDEITVAQMVLAKPEQGGGR